MVVDPWGKIVAQLGGTDKVAAEYEPEICFAEIDLSLVEKTRKEMPLLRRTDVYPEL